MSQPANDVLLPAVPCGPLRLAPLLDLSIAELLTGINFPVTDELLRRAAGQVDGVTNLDALVSSGHDADVVVRAWQAHLDYARMADGQNDLHAELLVQLLIRHKFVLISLRGRSLQRFLKVAGLNWLGTWREINLRLGGRLYANALTQSRSMDENAARLSFAAALQCWETVEALDGKAGQDQRRVWRGMRAVTQLFLARRAEDSTTLLRRALIDFEIAESCGDRSAQHFQMRAEAHLRLFMATADDAQLMATKACLNDASESGVESAELLAEWASFFFACGLRALTVAGARPALDSAEAYEDVSFSLDDGHQPQAGTALRAAAGAFTASALWWSRSIDTPASGDRDPAVARIKRGQAWMRAAHARRLLGLPNASQLNAALDDLCICNDTAAPIVGPYWPWVLLELACGCAAENTAAALGRARSFIDDGLRYAWRHLEADATITRRMATLGIEIDLRQAILDQDVPAVRAALAAALGVDDPSTRVAVAPLVYGGRLLCPPTATVDAEDLELIRGVVDRLEEVAYASDGGHRQFAASHAAGLLVRSEGWKPVNDCNPAVLQRVFVLSRLAAHADDTFPSAECLYPLGRAAIRWGRVVLSSGGDDDRQQALALFDEGIEAFQQLAEVARPVWLTQTGATPHTPNAKDAVNAETWLGSVPPEQQLASLLGEAHLRRYSLRRDFGDLRDAMRWLQRSADLGNATAQHLGLLGEAYLRHGRLTRNIPYLYRALELKEEARRRTTEDGNVVARESFSASAAAAYAIWRATGTMDSFATAATMAVYSAAVDQTWPWPVLQLADHAAAPAPVRAALPQAPPTDVITSLASPADLWAAVRRGDADGLLQEACRRAVANIEFRSNVLGGRSKAYILDDPHGLLSSTLVLKPAKDRSVAEREAECFTAFLEYLSSQGVSSWASTVRPLAVIDTAGQNKAVAVSYRAAGRQLSDLIASSLVSGDEGARAEALRGVERALILLAFVHGWRGVAPAGYDAVQPMTRSLKRNLQQLGYQDAGRRASRWARLVPARLPMVGKRDAHTDNWLITRSGEVVAVDLEASAFLPVGFEVAQLLEDMPLWAFDAEGMRARLEFARAYMTELQDRRPDLADRLPDVGTDVWQAAYACFAAHRAIYLLVKFGPGGGVQSSGSARMAHSRLEHARSALDWAITILPALAVLR